MKFELLCPVHGVKMRKSKILYGLPEPRAVESGKFKNVILGGCVVDMYGEYGYECPDGDLYYLNEAGELKRMFSGE